MPEHKSCKLLQPPLTSDKKKKKKKKRSRDNASAITPAENTRDEKPRAVPLHPETLPVSLPHPQSPGQPRGLLHKLRATGKKGGEGWRSKQTPQNSPAPLTATGKTSDSGAPARECGPVLRAQARESLRWEGALNDPQAEESRLELYRSNRRQRYIAHREALLNETKDTLRHAEHREKRF